MRFSPVTQTHAGKREPARGGVGLSHEARRGRGRAPPAPRRGRGRGRGGLGFSASEVTPLVVNGTMYIATPYSRVVALDPTSGKEIWAYRLPAGNPSTRGVEYWPGDAQTPAQIVFGSNDGNAVLAEREDRRAQRRVRRQGHRQPEHAGDPRRSPRPRRPELAACRLQESRHHRRDDAGEPAERAGRRRPRVGPAHRQAGVDVPLDSARR